ncbi:hypothetical protein EYF80_017916 [Liparis tanakae]|uniref:Uncharacterized protein n=1 Tax=Liparis tanakae TaxID=230148 RepID=A0A4Z2I1E4_9TELE|nr:hypothetical protein EYF80_017916 [Liparis tanakae]
MKGGISYEVMEERVKVVREEKRDLESQNKSPHKIQTQFAICENVWLPRVPWREMIGRKTAIEEPCFLAFLFGKK